MAENHISYPRIIIGKWWELRKLAKENPDISFTPKSIADMLDIAVNTAYINVYPALWQFELIHKNGSLTERGRKWLKDHKYKDVCNEIIENTYSPDLIRSIKDPVNNREDVKEWFLTKTKAPLNVVLQMTATYLMLSKGDPDEEHEHKVHKHTQESEKIKLIKKTPELIRPKRKYTKRNATKAIALVDIEPEPVPVNSALSEHEEITALENVNGTKADKATQVDSFVKSAIVEEKASHTDFVTGKKIKPETKISGNMLESKASPSFNINIQIIITSETPSAHIEAIFRNIEKHIL